jgi:hypothetical protein
MTAQQRTLKKLTIHHGNMVVGIAGHIGLGQRMCAALEDGHGEQQFGGRREIAVGTMRERLWRVCGPEWTAAGIVTQTRGALAAQESASTATVVALPLDGSAELVQFNAQCSPELATDALPWVAIGGGQPTADPFLGFIRRVVWTAATPSIRDGIFSAVWTLRHAVETAVGGITDPFQVCVLQRDAQDTWMARELPQDELVAHEEAIRDAESTLRGWRAQLSATPTSKAPQPPPE